jgi:hypothetical protein
LNRSLSIQIADGQRIALTFDDLSKQMTDNNSDIKNIYDKLTSLMADNAAEQCSKYEDQLVQISLKICNDINTKLADGILEPIEIVQFVSNAFSSTVTLIADQMEKINDKEADVKNMVIHFVLSLVIVIISALEVNNILKKESIKSLLDEVEKFLDGIIIAKQIAKIGKRNCTCCLIA